MARPGAWTPDMLAWLDERYGTTDVHELTILLNATFGCDKTETAVYVKANQRGLHRPRQTDRRCRCERAIRWSREPEMAAFMAEVDRGSIPAAQAKFEERFGFRPTPQQVSAYRTWSGTQSKAGRTRAQDWHRRAIGFERDTGKGYTLVKVRDDPKRPGSKDNWAMKHVLVWERTRGLSLPDGWVVLFCDGDHANLDPANLKAVPKSLVGIMNAQGATWRDRETCEAALALAMLKSGTAAAQNAPRRCGVCGRLFTPDIRHSVRQGSSQRTCRSCLDKGLRSPKEYGWRTCPVCGTRFHAGSPRSVYCSKRCRNRAANARKTGRGETHRERG